MACKARKSSKTADTGLALQINHCLDELEAAYMMLTYSKLSPGAGKELRRWIKRQKDHLKELNYNGTMPRKVRK